MSAHLSAAMLWGFIASAVMATVLQGGRDGHLTRLNLPFLVGTVFSRNRRRATIAGWSVFMLSGWVFAVIYFWIFGLFGRGGALPGAGLGLLHGAALVASFPFLQRLHPRTVIGGRYVEHRRLEGPGPFGLNYGGLTPLVVIAAYVVYGLILGSVFARL